MMWWVMLACSTQTEVPPDAVADVSKGTETYRAAANSLKASVESSSPDADLLAAASELTGLGTALLPSILIQHPECAEYFAAIAKAAPTMHLLDLATIESGYHADGKLPKAPGSVCYHGKDLVVHPATVAAMARIGLTTADQRKKAAHEIEEVLTHLEQVR